MDVHPPHQSIHTWRDFFVHLITITIGLLIALALESAAEWVHHRHLVNEARTSIRRELQENHKLLAEDLSEVRQDQLRIEDAIKMLAALRGGAKLEHTSLRYHIDWSCCADSAWRTSQSSGALNYMDYSTVESFTELYAQQKLVSDRGVKVFEDQSRAIAPIFISGDPNLMSKDETQMVLLRSADVLLDLRGLEQLLLGLDKMLTRELKSESTGHD